MISDVKIIGLCGRSGSGKGYVCEHFLAQGIPSVDTDAVYRDLLSKKDDNGRSSTCLCELVAEFGDGILGENGLLDRRSLSLIVFAEGDEDKLKRLNEIAHKHILSDTLRLIDDYSQKGFKAVIIDAPVLFESGFDAICDLTLCVTAPEDVLVKRICKRDGRTEREALMRLANQKSSSELWSLCDAVIVNDGVLDVGAQVCDFINEYIFGGENEI